MNNVVIAVRGGRVVEIYAQDRQASFTIVDWDESAPDESGPPDAYSFPAVPFSRLPPETLAAYEKARKEASDGCLVVTTASKKPEEKMVAFLPTQVCFDVTLKGYSALHNSDNPNRSAVERLRDDLVKWVVAPSKAALDRFLVANDLKDLLDHEPYPMSDHASSHCGLEDGVDFVLGSEGEVLAGERSRLRDWRAEVVRAAAFC